MGNHSSSVPRAWRVSREGQAKNGRQGQKPDPEGKHVSNAISYFPHFKN